MRQLSRVLPSFRSLAQLQRSGTRSSVLHEWAFTATFPLTPTLISVRCLWIPASPYPPTLLSTSLDRIASSSPTSQRISWLSRMEQRRAYASKLKKYKIKSFSSLKFRFREKANGEYKRWRAGKRHNAHSKTNKQLRQLRRPSVVPSAYAKVMKKLNFHG